MVARYREVIDRARSNIRRLERAGEREQADEQRMPNHRIGMLQQQSNVREYLVGGVDLRQMCLQVSRVGYPELASIPFSFIVAVWTEAADNVWELAVNGSLVGGDSNGNPASPPRFSPYLGGA